MILRSLILRPIIFSKVVLLKPCYHMNRRAESEHGERRERRQGENMLFQAWARKDIGYSVWWGKLWGSLELYEFSHFKPSSRVVRYPQHIIVPWTQQNFYKCWFLEKVICLALMLSLSFHTNCGRQNNGSLKMPRF